MKIFKMLDSYIQWKKLKDDSHVYFTVDQLYQDYKHVIRVNFNNSRHREWDDCVIWCNKNNMQFVTDIAVFDYSKMRWSSGVFGSTEFFMATNNEETATMAYLTWG